MNYILTDKPRRTHNFIDRAVTSTDTFAQSLRLLEEDQARRRNSVTARYRATRCSTTPPRCT